MKANWWYRFLFMMGVIVLSFMSIVPSMTKISEDSAYPIKSKINLGLDLQGGLYMIMGIDFKKVFQDEVKVSTHKIEMQLKDKGIEATVGEVVEAGSDDPKQWINLVNPADKDKAKEIVSTFFGDTVRLTSQEEGKLQYALGKALKDDIEKNSVSKSIEVIRNRIDEFGVSEPEITSQGKDRIVIQLPGVKDIERAKSLIGKTAKLEFKMVNDTDSNPAKLQEWLKLAESKGVVFKKGDRFSVYVAALNDILKADIPANHEIAFQRSDKNEQGEVMENVPYLVESAASISGDDLSDAMVRIDQQQNRPYVGIGFKSAGAKLFETVTEKNIGRRMAVILDGNVYTAPVIQTKIAGGQAQITLGNGDYNSLLTQAKDIALVLRAGALPVQLEFEEQRVVGPSLGTDSIAQSQNAAIVGCLAVFLFMIFYYHVSGVIAIFTLVVNVLIVLAFMVGIGATLTLPGIGGIALTVGMAVDANIIIYERIREELDLGRSNSVAVNAGFDRAFWTILDGNLTTALAGLALLNFGVGPIRGFAVTLLIGILATVYTGYFVSRIAFDFYLDNTNKPISI
ncbi:MAG: protein translocase subunit SecD [Bacteriovoracaceae bacterium]